MSGRKKGLGDETWAAADVEDPRLLRQTRELDKLGERLRVALHGRPLKERGLTVERVCKFLIEGGTGHQIRSEQFLDRFHAMVDEP
jgi:hypothetical protein